MSPTKIERAEGVRFDSPEEVRAVLDAVFTDLAKEPEAGSRLRAVATPLRLELPDVGLVLDVWADTGVAALRWKFSARAIGRPGLGLRMDSAVANRVLQGRESAAIAIVRGRLQVDCGDPAAAVRFFPAARPLIDRYREVLERDHRHLLVE